jgi:Family of unknown function (DUF6325)
MSETDELGPIDYLVVEFPDSRLTGEGFPLLVDLVDRGIIRILDLVFMRKDRDGSVMQVVLDDLDGDERLRTFQGVASGLLDSDDLREAARALEPGSAAGILLYENRWAAPFVAALRRANAQVVATGRIPQEELLAVAETVEAHR